MYLGFAYANNHIIRIAENNKRSVIRILQYKLKYRIFYRKQYKKYFKLHKKWFIHFVATFVKISIDIF